MPERLRRAVHGFEQAHIRIRCVGRGQARGGLVPWLGACSGHCRLPLQAVLIADILGPQPVTF